MSQVLITTTKLDDLADAISEKTNESTPMTIDDMTDAVEGITIKSQSDLTVSGATVTVPAGLYKTQTAKSVANMTLPSSVSNSSSGSQKSRIRADANGTFKYLNIPTGYNGTAQYYEIAPMVLEATTFTQNGTYVASDEDLDGYSSVTVNVSGGGGSTLITKSISANGTYNASSDNADGYSSVTVSVPTGVDGNNISYGLTDNTLALVGVAGVGYADV